MPSSIAFVRMRLNNYRPLLMHQYLKFIVLITAILFCSVFIQAQTRIETVPEKQSAASADGTVFRYLFENERFITKRVEIELNEKGQGRFSYVKKDAEETSNPLTISAQLLSQVQGLFDELRFLESQEQYQHKKDFSHLGNITLTLMRNGRERSAKFNYTDNPAVNRLVEIFRNIATQETRVYELQNVRNSDPISTPAQLRLLESELKSKHIADPERLMPLLQDIKMDEGVPLIARNHADRLIKSIQKGK